MTVTAHAYGNLPLVLANKEVDFDTDTIKVMLCTSSYTPNQSTDKYKSSVTNEVTGTGYTAGGATLTSKTVASSAGTTTLDAADVVWATSTITARYAVIYDSTGTDATSALIGYVDFGTDVVSSGGNFTITWDAAGIVTATVA